MLCTLINSNKHLEQNISKTKEMVINFGRSTTGPPTLQIDGQTIERVEEYKYLGTIIDHRLTFKSNTDWIFNKCQQHLHFLCKLRRLQVNKSILQLFYKSFIQSTLTFSILARFGSLSEVSKCHLNKIIRVSGKIVGRPQTPLGTIFERHALKKAQLISSDSTHILQDQYKLLPFTLFELFFFLKERRK